MSLLAEYFHKKFYSDLPFEDVNNAIHGNDDKFNMATDYVRGKHYSDMPIEDFESKKGKLRVFMNKMLGADRFSQGTQNIQEIAPISVKPIQLNMSPPELLDPFVIPEPVKPYKKRELSDFNGLTNSPGADYQLWQNYNRTFDRFNKEGRKDDAESYSERFFEQAASSAKEKPNTIIKNDMSPIEQLDAISNRYSVSDDYDYFVPSNKYIKLTQGRYNLGKVDTKFVDDVKAAAKKYGVDPLDILAVSGRESTFGNEFGKGEQHRDNNNYNDLFSAWDYKARRKANYAHYLADKKIPGASYTKTKEGMDFFIEDEDLVNKNISQKNVNEYLNRTKKEFKNMPINSLDYVARRIKEGTMNKYNPGDPDYLNKLKAEKDLLLKEKELMSYINK